MVANRDLPLDAFIQDDQLFIRIGVDVLAHATNHSPMLEDCSLNQTAKVKDNKGWAESEAGDTFMTSMLDDAILQAYEDGSRNIEDVVEE